MKFGELTVIRYLGNKYWECQCSCENKTIKKVSKGNLLSGSITSCGCKQYSRIEKEEIIQFIDIYTEQYKEHPFLSDIAEYFNKNEGHIRRYIKEYELEHLLNRTFGSKAEREIYRLFNNAILHNRSILDNGKELDIYIPDKKLAIEFNGSYWHSDLYKDKYYHQQKTIECAKKGIRLIHIFEYEWLNENKRAKLLRYLNSFNDTISTINIGARNTEIHNISNEKAKEFCNMWHLQNGVNSEINLGCFYKNELIGVMTFGKPRFNSNYKYELLRLCWCSYYRVNGGTEKLFKYFLNNINPTSIITYTDISKFTGNVYTHLGFHPIQTNSITEPNYVWVNSLNNHILTRYQTQKHKLIEQGLGTEDQTEDDIMKELGYLKIYDCGNIKLEWRRQQNG